MDTTKQVRLSEIAELITKGTTPTTLGFDFQDEGINFLKIECFSENGSFMKDKVAHISEECYEKLKRSQLEVGDILFSIAGAIGRVAMVTEEMLPANTNQALSIIRIKRKDIYLPYIKLVLTSPFIKAQFERKKQGVAQLNISLKDISELTIPFPEIDKQREYVTIFDCVLRITSACQQRLQKLDELVKSRFVEMFGLPGTDVHGWGMSSLGEICEINPKKSQDARLTSGLLVSFVPMPSVSESGDIDATQVKPYDEVKTGFTYFAENDVLFAKITPCMENGKGAVAIGLRNGIGFGSTEFHVLRPKKGMTTPCWIYTLTVFPQFRIDAASNMTGSAGQRRVPASFLENYRVSVPPLELQNRFAAFVSEVDKSKLAVKQSLEKLETLKKSLIQQYFG